MTTKHNDEKKWTHAEIGEDIIIRALSSERYEPSTRDIAEGYGVGESTVRKAKQAATRYAREVKHQIWGYHPQRNCYVIVPNEGGQATADAVLGYAARQVADVANMARIRHLAGYEQGYLTRNEWERKDETFQKMELLASN